jgi:hypothetical protein
MGNLFSNRNDDLLLQRLNERFDEQARRFDEQARRFDDKIDSLRNDVNQSLALSGMVLSSMNVYDTMSQTTADRVTKLKEKFCDFFGYHPGQCMITGIRGLVTLAHILPCSTLKHSNTLMLLGLEAKDLNDFRNLLLLSENIEFCFDRLKLSFIPVIGEGLLDVFEMKIWDDSIRDQPLYRSSMVDLNAPRIGQFEGRRLVLNPAHKPFKRCLAYQSLWACSKYLGGDFTPDSIPYRIDSLDESRRTQFMALVQSQHAKLRTFVLNEE